MQTLVNKDPDASHADSNNVESVYDERQKQLQNTNECEDFLEDEGSTRDSSLLGDGSYDCGEALDDEPLICHQSNVSPNSPSNGYPSTLKSPNSMIREREVTPAGKVDLREQRLSGRRSIHDTNSPKNYFTESTSPPLHGNGDKNIYKEVLEKLVVSQYPWQWCLAIPFLIIAFFVYYYYPSVTNLNSLSSESYYNSSKLEEEIFKKYSSQPKRIIRPFFDVINDIRNSKEKKDLTTVITLLYSHKQTAECLAKDFAEYAAIQFHQSKGYESLNGSSVPEDFSSGCVEFKKNIEKKGVLVVYNFQDIPADKVRHFHGICDRHSPYVEGKAIYLILLEINSKQESLSKAMEKVSSRVKDLWSMLEEYVLQPLITRLVEGLIIEIKQENSLSSC